MGAELPYSYRAVSLLLKWTRKRATVEASPRPSKEGHCPREQVALILSQGKGAGLDTRPYEKRYKPLLSGWGLGAINISYPKKVLTFCWMASISS